MYFRRTIEHVIQNISKNFSVLLLTGARQVGKTTILSSCSPERQKVSLDTLKMRQEAQQEPDLFLSSHPAPLLIDEIQYAPELLPSIKSIVDQKKEMSMYWITGSQQFHIMQNVAETLTGRMVILNLGGLSIPEIMGQPDTERFLPTKDWLHKRTQTVKEISYLDLKEIIWRGQYPALYETNQDQYWASFYDTYLQSYVSRDIRDLGNVGNEMHFFNLLNLLAARVGQLINYSDLARSLTCSVPTVMQWISILQATGIIYVLRPFSSNINTRITKMPKIYFLDTGLLCYLLNLTAPANLDNPLVSGLIFENFVIAEIIKDFWHHGLRPRISFYRDHNKREVDLLIEENCTIYPIEIKKKSNPDRHDIENFKVLSSGHLQVGEGVVICSATQPYPITKDVMAVPLFYI